MMTVCEKDKCTGCMACIEVCHKSAIKVENTLFSYNAYIDKDLCSNCRRCYNLCHNNVKSTDFLKPIEYYQGWSNNEKIRSNSTSGGLAYSLEFSFVKNGGYVCSCIFKDGEFVFEIVNTENSLIHFSGSKYVKSNPAGIYNEIKLLLKNNNRVLFVGLPCQVSALKRVIGDRLGEKLYTIDLICHGTPSLDLLKLFFNDNDINYDEISNISFRRDNRYQLDCNENIISSKGIVDAYSIAFLNSISSVQGCYDCSYSKYERVSDITLGDSWGSNLDVNEKNKGISLILCQTSKGKEILNLADVHLENVDIENAIANNKQLMHSPEMPKEREKFKEYLDNGVKFNMAVKKLYPKKYFKQKIKSIFKKY